jgi:Domain of unknown function (DUF3850)
LATPIDARVDLLKFPYIEPVNTNTTGTPAWDHELKTDPEVFAAVLDGSKTHEIRRNDRDFKVGDRMRLRETRYTGQEMRGPHPRPLEYTGREVTRTVSHIQEGYGLQPEWVILSFAANGGKGEAVAGWRLVPVEPTEAMIAAAAKGRILQAYVGAKEKADRALADKYRAMLYAAPQAECASRALDSGVIMKKAEMYGLPLNLNTLNFVRAIEAAYGAQAEGGKGEPPLNLAGATAYRERFVDALGLLCRETPPKDLCEAWLNDESESLQEWVVNHLLIHWASGIGTIEAAQHMANVPEESDSHEGYFEDSPKSRNARTQMYHLFGVTAQLEESPEFAMARYHDYFVRATSLDEARGKIMAYDEVPAMAELWGAAHDDNGRAVICPATQLNKTDRLWQHEDWKVVQLQYELLNEGPESLSDCRARLAAERVSL